MTAMDIYRIDAWMLAMEHALKVHAGEELGAAIIESLDEHLECGRRAEPPEGFPARVLLNGWRIPT